MADQTATLATAAMGVGTTLDVAPVSMIAASGSMGPGTSGDAPAPTLTAQAQTLGEGTRTAADLPAPLFTIAAASQPQGAQAKTDAAPTVQVQVGSRADRARLATTFDPSEIRSALGAMGPGTAEDATDVPLTLTGRTLPEPSRHSADARPQVGVQAASRADKARLRTAVGYGEMQRCTVTVTDVLTLDVALSDTLVLDVSVT